MARLVFLPLTYKKLRTERRRYSNLDVALTNLHSQPTMPSLLKHEVDGVP